MRHAITRSTAARSLMTTLIAVLAWSGQGVSAQAARGTAGHAKSPPVVSISAPAPAATVTGTVPVSGSAFDAVALAGVAVEVDTGGYHAAVGTTSWSYSLDTTGFSNGSHTITAQATDTSGLTAVTTITVTMSNRAAAPVVSITAPTAGSTVSGPLLVQGTASSAVGVARVQIEVDDGPRLAATGTANWTASVDIAPYLSGLHAVTAWVTDSQGGVAVTGDQVRFGAPLSCATSPAGASVAGTAFEDLNRNALQDPGEPPLAAQTIYLFNSSETAYLGAALTDALGHYSFNGNGLSAGPYLVEFATGSWWQLRESWVPDTTGSTYPKISVCASGATAADFGWRPITRSTDAAAPLASFIGPNGLTVQTYDDAVSPLLVFNHLMTGSLIGPEASSETVRFDLGATSVTSSSVVQVNTTYTTLRSVSTVTLDTWLDSPDDDLFHEYGHAWSNYYAYIVRQDPTMAGYLQARGLSGNPLVNSSYIWSTDEMIAEDYRQLFGSSSAQSYPQANRGIPPAAQVLGLRGYLVTNFRQPAI